MTLRQPTTGWKAVDRFAMLDVTWYEAQLARIGDGLAPRADLSAWSAIGLLLRRAGPLAFAPRRA